MAAGDSNVCPMPSGKEVAQTRHLETGLHLLGMKALGSVGVPC